MNILKNGQIIVKDCVCADSFLKKLFGRIFCSKPVFLKNCNSIHTVFLSEPIDVIFLDKNKKVVKLLEYLPKNCVIFPVKNAISVIELDAGFIKSAKINLGDVLE